jgi:hypothetical protein
VELGASLGAARNRSRAGAGGETMGRERGGQGRPAGGIGAGVRAGAAELGDASSAGERQAGAGVGRLVGQQGRARARHRGGAWMAGAGARLGAVGVLRRSEQEDGEQCRGARWC